MSCTHIFCWFWLGSLQKIQTRKDKMWLAALNMPGFSYQTDALILPVDFHILGPRVASDILMQMGMQVPFHTA